MLRVAGRRISSSFLCRSAHSSSSAFFSRNPVNASDSPSDGSTRSVYSPHPYLLEHIKGFASDSLATARDMGKIPDIPAAVAAVKNPASKIVYDDHHHELYPPGNTSKRALSSLRDPQDDSARVNTMNVLRPLSPHLPIYKRAFSSLPQDDSASVNNMNILRPLSPHLPIYKPQLSSTSSIFHRITGAFLSTMVLGFYLVCLKAGLICFTFESFYQFLFSSSKLFLLSLEISALALSYHLFNGVRHLLTIFRDISFLEEKGLNDCSKFHLYLFE